MTLDFVTTYRIQKNPVIVGKNWFRCIYEKIMPRIRRLSNSEQSNPSNLILELKWNWNALSKYIKINYNKLCSSHGNINIKWNAYYLLSNPNVTLDCVKFIDRYMCKVNNYEICVENISHNHNIKISDIIETPDIVWVWNYLYYNKFSRDRHDILIKYYRRHLAAILIQQWCHRIRLDPRHPVGIRRLEREYDQLFPSM